MVERGRKLSAACRELSYRRLLLPLDIHQRRGFMGSKSVGRRHFIREDKAMSNEPTYEFTLFPYREGYDHQRFRLGSRGHGFVGIHLRDGKKSIGLERCPKCERENYYAAVLDCELS